MQTFDNSADTHNRNCVPHEPLIHHDADCSLHRLATRLLMNQPSLLFFVSGKTSQLIIHEAIHTTITRAGYFQGIKTFFCNKMKKRVAEAACFEKNLIF